MAAIIALLLALTVPVGQLRTAMIENTCCCPDPTRCHCPDHDGSHGDQPQLRACHKDVQAHVAPTISAFTAPSVTVVPAPAAPAHVVVHTLHRPHAAPPPARPDAPS